MAKSTKSTSKRPVAFHLATYARVLQVHPRTIVRKLAGDVNARWQPYSNPTIPLSKVAKAFGCSPDVIAAAINGKDALLSAAGAVALLNVPARTVRYQEASGKLMAAIRSAGVVRFSKRDLLATMQPAERVS